MSLNNTNFIKAVRFIYEHIDQPIALADMAKSIGISVSSLKRLFMEATNQSPGAFIRRIRLEFSFRSLQSRKDSILEVALISGFENQSAFARQSLNLRPLLEWNLTWCFYPAHPF